MRGIAAPATIRFWEKVAKGDGCWLWTGGTNQKGYGLFQPYQGPGGTTGAHRFSYQEVFGPTPLLVLHHCDNPPCVRPDHLYAGTQGDNMRDRSIRGRTVRGESVGRAKLTEEAVRDIRRRSAEGESSRHLGLEYGVVHSVIQRAVRRESWKHVA